MNPFMFIAVVLFSLRLTTSKASLLPEDAVKAVLDHKKLPVVYVYTVVEAVCGRGLPDYIKIALEQAILSQPDCDVILASNFGECKTMAESVRNVKGLKLVDTSGITSARTADFKNSSKDIFQTDGHGELWLTSALRFFLMEDIMVTTGMKEMMHVEADNMLYGKLTSILDIFRKGYRALAATPLNANKSFITASVLWVANLKALQKFNDFMLGLAHNTNGGMDNYLKWLRFFACCKPGGIAPDAEGKGIKPHAVNEMSMLAYYHEIEPLEFQLLPVVPAFDFVLNRYVINMSKFSPLGTEVGPATGHGIWDPNSWGQLIGGTSSKKGRDIGFTDSSHIAGQAIRMNGCVIEMVCGNQTTQLYSYSNVTVDGTSAHYPSCHTAPFVRCSATSPWTPLWNLHVHSKHTSKFVSLPCDCPVVTRRALY